MRIYFTIYLIPVVLAALGVFWLLLRDERHRFLFVLALSVAVLAVLHPIFAAVAVGLVVVTHQLVALRRAERLSGGRVVLIAVLIAVITLGIGKYGQRGATAIWGPNDWFVAHLIMPLGISYFVFRLLQYVFDCLRGVIQENSLLRLAAFVMFIPTFPAGPSRPTRASTRNARRASTASSSTSACGASPWGTSRRSSSSTSSS